MNATSACLTDEEISALAEGARVADDGGRAERHLSSCGLCRRLLSDAVMSAPSRHLSDDKPRFTLPEVDPARFEIGPEIARGGMGRIHRAWDVRHERSVALKLVLESATSAAERFTREVRVLSKLQHPSIVPLYEAGRFPDGEQFFSMRLVEGGSLAEAIHAARGMKERLALLPNLLAVADALAYAHAERVVHRDLKPSNVLVGKYGETLVIDWGLAKELDPRDLDPASFRRAAIVEAATLSMAAMATRPGQALGTPWYMPPEQARGDVVDTRADVYALGAMLYHLLSGAPPYDGDRAELVVAQVLAGPPKRVAERVPSAPPELAALVDKAMARAPVDRYPTAQELAADLRRFVGGERVAAHRYTALALSRRWVGQHRAGVLVGVTLAASAAVVAGVTLRSAGLPAALPAPIDSSPADTTSTLARTDPPASLVPSARAEPMASTPSTSVAIASPASVASVSASHAALAPSPKPMGGRVGFCYAVNTVTYEGDADLMAIRSAADKVKAAVTACFTASRFEPPLHVSTWHTVVVDGQGGVVSVTPYSDQPPKLDACVVRALRGMHIDGVTNGKGGTIPYTCTSRLEW